MVVKKARGLGKGLGALLGPDTSTEVFTPKATDKNLPRLSISKLQAGKYQARFSMSDPGLQELAASIQEKGIINPILVRKVAEKKYEILAGERRFRAAQIAGLKEVPVIIREVSDEDALAIGLIENLQREDLNAIEAAAGVQRLVDEFKYSHEKAAQAIGRSRPAVSNLLRLLTLAEPVQQMLRENLIDMGHARALLTLDKATQIQLAKLIAAKGLSVREAELLVEQAKKGPVVRLIKEKTKSRDILRLEEELADSLGATVKLSANSKGKGKLQIAFANLEQLDGIIEKIRNV